MRCEKCSGPDLKGKKIGYRHLKVRQDAMICINCVDRHAQTCGWIKQKIFELMLQVYEGQRQSLLGVN